MSLYPFQHLGDSKKVIACLLFTVYCLLGNVAFGACQPTTSCDKKSDPLGYTCYSKGKYSYECNVENFCLGKAPGADPLNYPTPNKQLIEKHDPTKYPDLSKEKAPSFEDLRKIYEETQNNIMNCATLKSKYELHRSVMEDLIIPPGSKKVLQKANQTIEKKMKEQKCIEPRDGDKVYNYKNLLDSMTYEQCGYSMYLNYYDQNARNNIGILGNGKSISTVSGWNDALGSYNNKIAAEQELSERTMSTALSIYGKHESTYPSHILAGVIGDQMNGHRHTSNGIVKAFMYIVKLINGAQVSEDKMRHK